MASNEEILNLNKPYGRNWEDFLLPDQMKFLHRAMDAARKDEVEKWEKFREENYWILCTKDINPNNNGKYYDVRGTTNNKTHYTFTEFYTIFKQQNS